MQERSLDQIQNMYHSAINERSQMKVDLQVSQNKLQKSLSRQQQLEKKFDQ